MSTSQSYEIHTEARGAHWVGWVTLGAGQKPERSVVVIAATQEEAEARARRLAEESGR